MPCGFCARRRGGGRWLRLPADARSPELPLLRGASGGRRETELATSCPAVRHIQCTVVSTAVLDQGSTAAQASVMCFLWEDSDCASHILSCINAAEDAQQEHDEEYCPAAHCCCARFTRFTKLPEQCVRVGARGISIDNSMHNRCHLLSLTGRYSSGSHEAGCRQALCQSPLKGCPPIGTACMQH